MDAAGGDDESIGGIALERLRQASDLSGDLRAQRYDPDRARVRRNSAGGCAGTGPSHSTSRQGSTCSPSPACRRVPAAESPLVTCKRPMRQVSQTASGPVYSISCPIAIRLALNQSSGEGGGLAYAGFQRGDRLL